MSRRPARPAGAVLAIATALVWGDGTGLVGAADPCTTTVGSVSGTVIAQGGGPLAGARVRVQGCVGDPVLTAADGGFTLPVPAGAVVVAAAQQGYYTGCALGTVPNCATHTAGDSGLTIGLDPLPADDDPAHVFRDPEACRECHLDVFQQWDTSTMAHTNRNRWVDNLYNGTDLTMPSGPPPDPQNPPFFGFLSRHNTDAAHPTRNGECANCHQPEYVGTDPQNTNFNASSAASFHGVSCDFCHKVVEVDVSTNVLTHPNLVEGKTTVLRSTSVPQLEFGPLDDVTFPGGSRMAAAWTPVMGSSRMCAACHEDSTDPRDANGDFLGTYTGPASQSTYSEWAGSDFAARGVQCQDCHMPPTGATQFCSQTSNVRDPSQVRSHTFEGTTADMLRRAAKLRLASVVDGQTLTVTAAVSNVGAGHDLPTGVTLRNLILVIDATDRTGARLSQLTGSAGGPRVPDWGGVGDPAGGAFAGLSGRGYARVLVDQFLVENVLFTEAVNAFDNRIAAGATDTSQYVFTLPRNWRKRDIRVQARLYYRRAFKPTADQRKWNIPLGGNPHGTRGDGTDYDENFVMAEARNFLTCRGTLGEVHATLTGAGSLSVRGTLRLPARTTFDPGTDGAGVALGYSATPNSLLQEEVTGFARSGATLTFAGNGSSSIDSLAFTRRSRRSYRLALAASKLDIGTPAGRQLLLGIDSGEVCFRHVLHCKSTAGGVSCH